MLHVYLNMQRLLLYSYWNQISETNRTKENTIQTIMLLLPFLLESRKQHIDFLYPQQALWNLAALPFCHKCLNMKYLMIFCSSEEISLHIDDYNRSTTAGRIIKD